LGSAGTLPATSASPDTSKASCSKSVIVRYISSSFR
jgi:hypothetical protein